MTTLPKIFTFKTFLLLIYTYAPHAPNTLNVLIYFKSDLSRLKRDGSRGPDKYTIQIHSIEILNICSMYSVLKRAICI